MNAPNPIKVLAMNTPERLKERPARGPNTRLSTEAKKALRHIARRQADYGDGTIAAQLLVEEAVHELRDTLAELLSGK